MEPASAEAGLYVRAESIEKKPPGAAGLLRCFQARRRGHRRSLPDGQKIEEENGGRGWDRTSDPYDVNVTVGLSRDPQSMSQHAEK
jgi:hypothetical protein